MTTASTSTRDTRLGATVVVLAPTVLLVALVAHPLIAVLPDPEAIAGAVQAGPGRWLVVHVLTALGIALLSLAFLAVRRWLRDAGEERYSRWALPWVLLGGALYGLLPGLEFAPFAAARTGGDAAAAQDALTPVFSAVLVTSAVAFAIGAYGFARAVAASGALGRSTTRLVVTCLLLMALARFVPLGVVQFYVQALAGVAALWPLAAAMWRRPGVPPAYPERQPGGTVAAAAARTSG